MSVLAAVQSNYIPWKGYFDLIHQADIFVLYDDVQYSKNSWRNRNQIKTAQGLKWLTIPVTIESLAQTILETKIADLKWAENHCHTIERHYASAPYFSIFLSELQPLYQQLSAHQYLWQVNHALIKFLCSKLGITTPLVPVWDYDLQGDRNERLIALCKKNGCDTYLSGPSAQAYLDEDLFRRNGINVRYILYGPYREYNQFFPPFAHEVSILDLLLHTGDDARKFMEAI